MGNVVSRFGQNDPPSQPQDLCAFDAYGLLSYYNASVTPGYPAVPPPDPVGYGGQWGNYTDTETGYVLMTYRYYSPTYCRFLTRDPQGYGGGINLYAYVRNNPINAFDPLGLEDDSSPEDVTLSSTTSLGTAQVDNIKRRNVNREINRQIATPLANGVQTAADLHPWSPIAKAWTGKDHQGKKLSKGARAFESVMAAAVIVGPAAGSVAEELTASVRVARRFRGAAAKAFDWVHIFDNHAAWGSGALMEGSKKTVFRAETEAQIKAIVLSAWKSRKALKTQYDPEGNAQILYEGYDRVSKHTVHFWFVIGTRTVRSAYPIR